ncbi:kinase-like protein, partial [Clavulina sp. PMI_390]
MLAINSYVDGGRFQILDVLGKGGSGTAYLAYDTHSSPKHPKYYAIKCVPRPANDADASALLREIRLHKLVSTHPGIVTLKRCIQEGPYQLFVMDFLAGGDLFRQITQQHRYFHSDALITDVFLQIIDAVHHCHENGVFHRDLKPENILCNQDGTRVVLADFGLATRQPISDDLGVGSGYYMSPECNAGPAYSTIANDMWSLGVILCNLAFGRNPWAQAVMSDATFAAYAANPVYLSSILPASPATAHILTGPHGLFSLDPRRRMSLAELRAEVCRVTRWTMTDDEVRYAS